MRNRPRASTSGKAAGRVATPSYDSSVLEKALGELVVQLGVSKAFQLHSYWNLPTGFAVRGRDALEVGPLVEAIVSAAPCCMLWFSDVRRIMMNLAMEKPGLIEAAPVNKKVSSVIQFGDLMADRVMTVCSHYRRLASNAKKRQECLKSMSAEEAQKLMDIVGRIQDLGVGGQSDSQPASSGTPPSSAAPKRKGLPRTASDFFLATPKKVKPRPELEAEDGLNSPEAGSPKNSGSSSRFQGAFSPNMARLIAEAEACSPVPPRKNKVKAQVKEVQVAVKAQKVVARATAKAAAKAKAKAKTKAKAKAKAKSKSKEPASYDQQRALFDGSAAEWTQSPIRAEAIVNMSKSELRRRRFESHRPDLFSWNEESGKWDCE